MEKIAEHESNDMKWYVVKVQSNREKTIRDSLRRRIIRDGAEVMFGEVLVPVEKRLESTAGKTRIVEHKLFPGYLLIHMVLNEETWFLVRDTTGVGDFTGPAGRPAPMHESEIGAIITRQSAVAPSVAKRKAAFSSGDVVLINDGAFSGFNGTVDSVDDSNEKVTVLIDIFGRPTPVDLECWQLSIN